MSDSNGSSNFKTKILKVLAIIGGAIIAFLIGLAHLQSHKESKEEKKDVKDTIDTAKNTANDLKNKAEELNTLTNEAVKASENNNTDDRLSKLENEGVITRKKVT